MSSTARRIRGFRERNVVYGKPAWLGSQAKENRKRSIKFRWNFFRRGVFSQSDRTAFALESRPCVAREGNATSAYRWRKSAPAAVGVWAKPSSPHAAK